MQTIDDQMVHKPKPEQSYSLGFTFGLPARIIGVIITFIGVLALSSLNPVGFLFGPIMLLGGLFLLTTSYGTQIDYSNKYIREYGSFIGIKKGKWKNLDKFPYITVLTANVTTKSSDITGINSVVNTEEKYGVYLLSKSHYNKILLKRSKGGFKEAKAEAEKISDQMEKPLVKYSPKRISR